MDLCATSIILDTFCDITASLSAACPTDGVRSALDTILTDLPSGIQAMLPSALQSLITKVTGSRMEDTSTSSRTRTRTEMEMGSVGGATQIGAANGNRHSGEKGDGNGNSWINGFLGVGVGVSVLVGGLAAFF